MGRRNCAAKFIRSVERREARVKRMKLRRECRRAVELTQTGGRDKLPYVRPELDTKRSRPFARPIPSTSRPSTTSAARITAATTSSGQRWPLGMRRPTMPPSLHLLSGRFPRWHIRYQTQSQLTLVDELRRPEVMLMSLAHHSGMLLSVLSVSGVIVRERRWWPRQRKHREPPAGQFDLVSGFATPQVRLRVP